MNDLEKKLQDEIDKEYKDNPNVSKFAGKPMPAAAQLSVPSVAEQLLGVAESVKAIHRDMDDLQAEMVRRLDALRSRLGSRG